MTGRVTVTMTATGPSMGSVSYTREAVLGGDAEPVGMDDAVARTVQEAERAGLMLPGCASGLAGRLAVMSGAAGGVGAWAGSSRLGGGEAA